MRRAVAGTLSLVVAAAAGCGGPSAADKRAALERWEARADASCKASNTAIVARGWPDDLRDLDRLTVRAVDDIGKVSDGIQDQAAPKGSEARVAPFVDSLEALDPVMEQLRSRTHAFEPDELEAFAPKLQGALLKVEQAAKKLGLRHCAANEEHTWVPDAIRAPVFAQQLADLNREITVRARRFNRPARSAAAASRNLDRLSRVVGDADRKLSRLKPPHWADAAAYDYLYALRDVGGELDNASSVFAESTLTVAEIRAVRRKLDRTLGLERKRYKQLYRSIGAVPAAPDGSGGSGKDEAPGGEESQPA